MKSAKPKPKAKRAPRSFFSKIAGVTFRNPNGTSRQKLIRKYVRAGTPLELVPEPDNPYSENGTAIGVWVRTGWLFKRLRQVGYIRDGVSEGLTEDMENGTKVTAHVAEVTGGGWFKSRGVNIEITISRD
jgi:hypothetical protein